MRAKLLFFTRFSPIIINSVSRFMSEGKNIRGLTVRWKWGGKAIRNPFLGTAFGHLASEISSDEGQNTTILAASRIAKWAKPLPPNRKKNAQTLCAEGIR